MSENPETSGRIFIASTQSARALADSLDAWSGLVSSGYECPAAGVAMHQARVTLLALVEERERLYERLEMTAAFDGNGNRISVEPYSIPDGIEARDATIRLLDERVKALTDRADAADKWQEAFAAQSRKLHHLLDIPGVREALAELDSPLPSASSCVSPDLNALAEQYCEGWCKENGGAGEFEDCTGCEIFRAAIRNIGGKREDES